MTPLLFLFLWIMSSLFRSAHARITYNAQTTSAFYSFQNDYNYAHDNLQSLTMLPAAIHPISTEATHINDETHHATQCYTSNFPTKNGAGHPHTSVTNSILQRFHEEDWASYPNKGHSALPRKIPGPGFSLTLASDAGTSASSRLFRSECTLSPSVPVTPVIGGPGLALTVGRRSCFDPGAGKEQVFLERSSGSGASGFETAIMSWEIVTSSLGLGVELPSASGEGATGILTSTRFVVVTSTVGGSGRSGGEGVRPGLGYVFFVLGCAVWGLI